MPTIYMYNTQSQPRPIIHICNTPIIHTHNHSTHPYTHNHTHLQYTPITHTHNHSTQPHTMTTALPTTHPHNPQHTHNTHLCPQSISTAHIHTYISTLTKYLAHTTPTHNSYPRPTIYTHNTTYNIPAIYNYHTDPQSTYSTLNHNPYLIS